MIKIKNTIIQEVKFRKISTSQGQPTVECEVETAESMGRASAPLPISSLEKAITPLPRDIDQLIKEAREEIMPEIIGLDAENQNMIDEVLKEIDGTNNFSKIGGAVSTSLSIAIAKAAANSMQVPLYHHLGGTLRNELPYHLTNLMGGGKFTETKAPNIKEFLFAATDVKNISEAIWTSMKAHKMAEEKIEKKSGRGRCKRIDEGAWVPEMTDREALEVLKEIQEELEQFKPLIGVDFAGAQLWEKEKYGKKTKEEHAQHVKELINEFNLAYVEDPFHWKHKQEYINLKKETNTKIVGDDLYATNKNEVKKNWELADGIVIKPDRVGTITGTYKVTDYAKEKALTPVLAQRSGETTDNYLAHLAVAFRVPFLKIGSVGGERTSKLNELIRIDETIETSQMAEL